MNNLTIVTAVYYSPPTSVMGGRGWDFTYYKPTLYALSRLQPNRVVVYHDIVQQNSLRQFVDEYKLTNFELILCDLQELPFYDTIHAIKAEKVAQIQNDLDVLYTTNRRLHILCLSKLWYLEQVIKKYKLTTESVVWTDAGFFHHAMFPESAGGVELVKFDLKNYYPDNPTSKINTNFANKLDQLIQDTKKFVGFGTEVIRLPLEWTDDIATTNISLNMIGGLFGGTPERIHNISKQFYAFLTNILAANIVPLEEGILSVMFTQNKNDFYINTFDTWYHDVPTDPCYFLTDDTTDYSFYRCVFDLIENKKPRERVIHRPVSLSVPTPPSTLYEDFGLPNIAVYGSHNASIAVENGGKILEVIEVERFLNVKNAGYAQYYVANSRQHLAKIINEYLTEKYGFTEYGYCLHQHCETLEDDRRVLYWKQFPAKQYVECRHHESHAAGTFYQSSFENALIVSFDGGGNDGFFKIYEAHRGKPLQIIKEYRVDLGFPYMIFGEYLGDVKKEHALNLGNLVYAGKILGLQSYGTVREDWLPAFKDFYLAGMTGVNYDTHFTTLGEKIGVAFNTTDRLTGQVAYDVAATSQRAFETVFFEFVDDVIMQYPELPICISGGCALNIVLNTKVKQRYNREVFIGPNPNDCGLAVGMLANMIKPVEPIDITYAGVDMLDKHRLAEYAEKYSPIVISSGDLAQELQSGKIVGVIQGRAEHGPRALGNRSILCNPLIADMKDVLNEKVKHREWYRPFAPVVRLEDVSEYFEWDGESRWMSFCPRVKDKYVTVIPAIVHVDNTARVQTVTREQNEFIYDLLTEFKKLSGVGVLLNTSFNVDGKPILSTYTDAFKVLETTQLDALYINGFYFNRKIGVYER
jgi:carbamoyltransferase